MTIYAADISYYQPIVNDSYTRQWLILRCSDGDFSDPNAPANAGWCRQAKADGRLWGWTAYVVYRPGKNAAAISKLTALGPLDRVMIDVESWSGQITGNHSTEINQLATSLAGLVGQDKVWGYGNLGDLAAIWPYRPAYVQMIVAAYRDSQPTIPNQIGWQYTDGVVASGNRPLSSPPFGQCDMNELYVDALDPLGGGTPIEGDDMFSDADRNLLENCYAALLTGGPSMKDGGKSISESLAEIHANTLNAYNALLVGGPSMDDGQSIDKSIKQIHDAVKALAAKAGVTL